MDMFLDRYPSVDMHGYDRESARVATNDFVEENVILKKEKIVIIHGIGEGIVKRAVHEALKVNKKVLEGCDIDTDEYSGFAFGIGVERTAMGRFGIDDIRLLYENDVRFLKQFK